MIQFCKVIQNSEVVQTEPQFNTELSCISGLVANKRMRQTDCICNNLALALLLDRPQPVVDGTNS